MLERCASAREDCLAAEFCMIPPDVGYDRWNGDESMNRRSFLSAAGSALAAAGFGLADGKTRRVGLIGSGWYGKSDLLRLVQVAPIEVVSLCDVDKNMLADAAEIVASRQASKKKPRTFSDYREMLAQRDLDIVEV